MKPTATQGIADGARTLKCSVLAPSPRCPSTQSKACTQNHTYDSCNLKIIKGVTYDSYNLEIQNVFCLATWDTYRALGQHTNRRLQPGGVADFMLRKSSSDCCQAAPRPQALMAAFLCNCASGVGKLPREVRCTGYPICILTHIYTYVYVHKCIVYMCMYIYICVINIPFWVP